MRAFFAVLPLCVLPALAEHYIRIDAEGRSYTLDTDSAAVLRALKPVSQAKAAAQLPQWLWPVPGMEPDEVHLDISSGQVSANFRCAAALDDLIRWYKQSMLAHGNAVSSLPAAGGQQITGATAATIITVTVLPDAKTGALTVRTTFMPRQAPTHSEFEAVWYDDNTGILRLRGTSTGDEYEMDKRSILQDNLNRSGAVESKGAGMPSWLAVYPGAVLSPKGRIHWMLDTPTAEFLTRGPVKQVYQYYLDLLQGTDAKITRSGLPGSSSDGGPKHYGGEITALRGDDKVEIKVTEVDWMFGGFGIGQKTPEEKTSIGIRYMVPKR